MTLLKPFLVTKKPLELNPAARCGRDWVVRPQAAGGTMPHTGGRPTEHRDQREPTGFTATPLPEQGTA